MTWNSDNYDKGWEPLKQATRAIAEKWGVQVSIKDKYGRLDIDWHAADGQEFDGVLHEIGIAIELASEQTCQFCGSRSYVEQTDGSWVYTLCRDCRGLVFAEIPG